MRRWCSIAPGARAECGGGRPRFAPVLLLGALLSGCDSGSFVPPRPPELSEGPAPAAVGAPGAPASSRTPAADSSRAVEVVVGPQIADDAEAVKAVSRAQAGLEKARIRISVAGEKGNPAEVAEVVRQALARDPMALVVEPARRKDPALIEAIAAARGRGVPVVLFGRPLEDLPRAPAPPAGGKSAGDRAVGPLIRVEPESLESLAKSIVAAALNNARNAKLRPEDGAVVVVNKEGDSLLEDRVCALRGALKDAGIRAVDELPVTRDVAAARAKLGEHLRADTRPVVVLGTDHRSLTASYQVTSDLGESRPIIVAGFTSDESGANMARVGEFAAVAVLPPDWLLRKAITAAVQAGRGQGPPERVAVMVPLHVSPSDSAAPTMYRAYVPSRKGAPGGDASKETPKSEVAK